MRLIDADALLKALNDYGLSYRADINGMIMQAPTIEPSGDLISRADALKAVRKCKFESDMPSYWYRGMEDAQDIIENIPSADAVQGEWIMHIDDLFPEESTQECSNCHEHETIKICNDNFCPNCGAKMDGERRKP